MWKPEEFSISLRHKVYRQGRATASCNVAMLRTSVRGDLEDLDVDAASLVEPVMWHSLLV